jgi:CelD/BcsL family acetyltransferase involved in cellulose biosynthesis
LSHVFLTFEGANALQAQASQWDDLLRRTASRHEAPAFFLERSWLEPWLSQADADANFLIAALVDTDTGEWQAALPMYLSPLPAGAVGQRLSVAGFPASDCVFIPATSDEALQLFVRKLLHHWLKNMSKAVSFDLRELPQDEATERALAEWNQENGERMFFINVSRSPMVMMADMKAAGGKTTGKLGRNLRRRLRQLEEAGAAEFEFRSLDAAEVETHYQKCQAIEDQSWKGREGVGVLGSETAAAMQTVWTNLAEQKRLGWAGLKLDGELIAYHWGMVCNDVFLSYNLAQLPEHNKLSPGTLLLDFMIHQASELGLQSIDASRGGIDHDHSLSPYKGPIRYHRRAVIYRKTVIGRMLEWRQKRNLAEQDAPEAD